MLDDIGGYLHFKSLNIPFFKPRVWDVKLDAWGYTGDGMPRELSKMELKGFVHFRSTIVLMSQSGNRKMHTSTLLRFTLEDMLEAIRKTEADTRANTRWFGRIDRHHVYFEGLAETDYPNLYKIQWGS